MTKPKLVSPPESFQTARLSLRKPRPTDAPLLFASYAQDPEVTRFLLWRPHAAVSNSETFIEHALENWAGGSTFTWFLFTRADDELVGCIAARPKDAEVELGYVLARKFWGRGVMLEAITTITNWAFTDPAVSRVTAFCDIENTASARLLEKAGFRQQAILERWSVHPNISKEPRDCYAYATLRSAAVDPGGRPRRHVDSEKSG